MGRTQGRLVSFERNSAWESGEPEETYSFVG